MPYTNEEGGLLNNFAKEPKVYQAEPPTSSQKRTYIVLGIAAMLLIVGVIFVAFSVSNVS
ncbi:ssl1498 family light-harvesting-like protein [Anabaena sp. UHCC 0187]|uniref:photosystem II assembly protein Psb34 n=1 Tax=Anabaena sp. UHCC 0187 TaxID=2590018 RepID=UPI001445168C|nr:ssl1498 family light-harvesting-like protein [Anabaena sp. UHCC 0187]MDP5018518.1 ssl1498 family light-harvesting-like protein [Dolichospermum sp.]MTJ13733.1 ssl1498 family light-harvesting-like protein [Anabaena sp. UHCC 0187]